MQSLTPVDTALYSSCGDATRDRVSDRARNKTPLTGRPTTNDNGTQPNASKRTNVCVRTFFFSLLPQENNAKRPPQNKTTNEQGNRRKRNVDTYRKRARTTRSQPTYFRRGGELCTNDFVIRTSQHTHEHHSNSTPCVKTDRPTHKVCIIRTTGIYQVPAYRTVHICGSLQRVDVATNGYSRMQDILSLSSTYVR